MGNKTNDRRPLAWQGSLREMLRQGARLAFCCTERDCKAWIEQDIAVLGRSIGLDASLWDDRPPCPKCGVRGRYMASPGPATPFLPLLSGPMTDAVRKVFLAQFGFTKRDIIRIRLMAEEATALYTPAALNDLDVPYRVGVAMEGSRSTSGKELGQWKGRTLIYWPMHDAEREAWARKRRGGPKALPSARPPNWS